MTLTLFGWIALASPLVLLAVAVRVERTLGRYPALVLVLYSALGWFSFVGVYAREVRSRVVVEDEYAHSPLTPAEIFGPSLKGWYVPGAVIVDHDGRPWWHLDGTGDYLTADTLVDLAPFYRTEERVCLVPLPSPHMSK